jgi:cell wall-associated NlpC family hydrolase
MVNTTSIINSNGLPSFNRNTSSLIQIIKNCKAYYAKNNFYYSIANGVRSIPADISTNYSGKYYVDCSSFVTWVLYEYANANNNTKMKNYFSYQRNSATFASIGASGGNEFLSVVSSKGNNNVNLSLAQPGDILVFSNNGKTVGHVGIYIGNDKFVHASDSSTGVIISNLHDSWNIKKYWGARRIL